MAAITNLYVDAGSNFNAIITCNGSDGSPLNLAGYTVKSQIRKSYGSVAAYSFNPTIYAETAGKIRLSLTGAESSQIKPGRYMFDIEITKVIAATAITVGNIYTIYDAGDTDFTLIGAEDNEIGTSFIATGIGSGSGTVIRDRLRVSEGIVIITPEITKI